MRILAFGQIAEITGRNFELEISDTESLSRHLEMSYPELADMKFAIAVNKKVISQNTPLGKNDEIALMPPYSGG